MRLEVLNTGYRFGTKLFFAFVRLVSGHPLPDAAKLVYYRPDFYGTLMKEFTHESMRGPSGWSVADRELMAAYVSKSNQCQFCIGAHTATASRAYHDDAKVIGALSDLESVAIQEPLKSTLRLLGKLTRREEVTVEDMRSLLAVGTSREQIEDAVAICFAFNATNRLADAFGFDILSKERFDAGAKFLLSHGYR